MSERSFWEQLEERTGKYDLLCHPFYKAWTAGELTREDLREYAADYYHHVASFPVYLSALLNRLPEGELRQAVLGNFWDEQGIGSPEGRPHDAIWLDFAESMEAKRAEVRQRQPLPEVHGLIETFLRVARTGAPPAALAAFYAYESQVPRIAGEKVRGLREKYGADEKACGYFVLHQKADVRHAQVWREQLTKLLAREPEQADEALRAAEYAARALWQALDGIEARRQWSVASGQ